MASQRRLVQNFLVLFAGNITGQFFFFFGLALLARILGPSGFGAWNFAQVWMLYLLRVGEFGLEVIGIRETSRNPKMVSTRIATVVSVRLVMAILLFGVALLISLADGFPQGTTSLVLISALAVFPMAVLLEWVFEGQQEVGLISIARVLKGLLFFLGIVLWVSKSGNAETAAYLYVGSLALPGLIIFAIVINRFGFDWSSLSVRSGLEALTRSAPIGIATLLSQYSLTVATVVVGYLLSREELGLFTAAHRIVLFLWAYIITSMHRILLPSLSISSQETPSDYKQFVGRFFRLSVLLAVPFGLLGTLVATPLMSFLYSAQFESSGIAFSILIWGFVLASIRSIFEIVLIAADKQRQFMKGMVFLSVTYTVITPILTSKFGIVGACLSVVLSELCCFTYLLMTFPFAEPAALLKDAWKPFLAAFIAMASISQLAGPNPVLRLTVGLAIFSVALVVMKGVTLADIATTRSLIGREKVELLT